MDYSKEDFYHSIDQADFMGFDPLGFPPVIEEPSLPRKKTKGKQKIDIEFIPNKQRRQITFYKRKNGLIKKASELATLTGTQVLLLIASETGHVYSYTTQAFEPMVSTPENQAIIQSCIRQNTQEPAQYSDQEGIMSSSYQTTSIQKFRSENIFQLPSITALYPLEE